MTSLKQRYSGISAVGIFLFFGMTMASVAGIALAWPGTFLDHVWRLNAPAYARLAPLGKTAGMLFLVLPVTLTVAGIGWFKRLWVGLAACASHPLPRKCSAMWSTRSPLRCSGAPSGS
jgi:hypothetical protein